MPALAFAAVAGLGGAGCVTVSSPSTPAADEGAGPSATPSGAETSATDAAPPTPGEPEGTIGGPELDAPTGAAPESGGDPIEARRSIAGTEECRAAAAGPWASVSHGPDPLGAVRRGAMPAFIPDGPDQTPLDQLTEMPAVGDYRDPSTIADPDRLLEAFAAAGYQEGIDVRYEEGNYLTVITLVRFRDAAGAAAALSAHLADYCSRAERGHVRTDRTGLVLLRESDTVRTLFVLDDVEVSVSVCGCYEDDDDERLSWTERWSDDIIAVLRDQAPTPAPV